MKLFLCTASDQKTHHLYEQLYCLLVDMGVILFTNQQSSKSDAGLSFANLNGLIIVHHDQNQEAGYLSALAISQKKPILYLLAKGSRLPEELSYIRNNKEVAKYLVVKFYDLNNINNRVAEFIELIEKGDAKWDMPTIKFTWRITPRIDRYLQWRTINTGQTKADWLRKYMVETLINEDEEYKKFLRSE
ncbi:MAG: hypothetical protein ABH884_04075 [Candidatus Komeilibacteria bacterium]